MNLPYFAVAVVIWVANSRVGVKINTRGLVLVMRTLTQCRAGNTNAAVLPVPVCAQATTSLPAKMFGIALAWTGVGLV